jgi:dienelactone hydrolase
LYPENRESPHPDLAGPNRSPWRLREHGLELFVGTLALVLIAILQPEYAVGQGFLMKLFFALLYLPLLVAIAFGALRIAGRLPTATASVILGSWIVLTWCFFALLASFPIEPFGTSLPLTVAASMAAAILVTAAIFLAGKAAMALPILFGIACLCIAVLSSISYCVYQAFAGSSGTARADMLTERDAVRGVPFPGDPGNCQVRTLTYGNGTDRHRPEYGAGVAIRTRTVSGAPFLPDQWSVARTGYWGFDESTLPINGRVWYPEGKGPFPLVVIVHGMCGMTRFSDGGFAYLGELLASRGYVVASVDENFLNPGGYRYGGFTESDIDARGWLLLQHLKVWELWNRDPKNRFHGRIDMERIALIGHSRGGEAIAAAAAFNRMGRYPRNGNIPFDFHFGIRTLIAFAPTDITQSRYERSTPPRIENVNYLLLEGTHDRQVPSVIGSRVFQRVRFTDPGRHFVKSSVYVGGANHSQFNSDWGIYDLSFPTRLLTDMRAQLGASRQREITKTLVSGFLDATLKADSRYLPLFRDHRLMRGWLPRTTYVSRYEDSDFRAVANFDEDIDLSTTTVPGGTISGEGLALWREQDIDPHYVMSLGSRANRVLSVGWEAGSARPPSLGIGLPEKPDAFGGTGPSDRLTFSIAFPDATASPYVDVVLADRSGRRASLPLSEIFPVPPAQRYSLTRLGFLETPSQVLVLQTVSIPLAAFLKADPRLDIESLREIAFRFDGKIPGRVLLDDIGICATGPIPARRNGPVAASGVPGGAETGRGRSHDAV